MDVRFRRLTDADLPLLHRWLNEPGVVVWWEDDDVSWEAVVRDYGGGGDAQLEHWLAFEGDRPVAWLQCFPAAAYVDDPVDGAEPRAWFAAGADPDAGSMDYLLGDPADRGRGLGAAILDAFVGEVMFGRHPGWSEVVVSPQLANVASWRALQKAGFRHLADIEVRGTTCRAMVRDRSPSTPAPMGPERH